MNNDVIVLNIFQFAAVYLLLVIVLAIMKCCKVNQSKLLIWASFRMTAQLTLTGFVITYLFTNPNPLLVTLFVSLMTAFAVFIVLGRNKGLNKKFKLIVTLAIMGSALSILVAFLLGVVGVSVFDPQYVIPIAGMLLGNCITAVSLAIRTFGQSIKGSRSRIETLINLGVHPKKILTPFVNSALETAILPTLNSMLGMGIVSLPGMMTGQILSGTLPTTAIMYQIAIMIAITTVNCLSAFLALHFGAKTMYNDKKQIEI